MFFDFLKKMFSGFGDFLGWVFDHVVPAGVKASFEGLSKEGFKGMVFFVLKIFTHWYFFMTIAAVIVVYNLFIALGKTGILEKFTNIVVGAVHIVLQISANCFPLITDLNSFFRCVSNS